MRSFQPTENDSDLFHLENGAVARQRLYSLKSLNSIARWIEYDFRYVKSTQVIIVFVGEFFYFVILILVKNLTGYFHGTVTEV